MIRSGRVSFYDALAPLMVPIGDVHPATWNYNNGDIDALAESIHRYGMYRPVQSQVSSGDIVVGNHTWLACSELGSQIIPLVPMDIDDATARSVMIEDNEIARRAIRDRSQMLDLLNEVHQATGEYLVAITDREVEALVTLEAMPLRLTPGHDWPTLHLTLPPNLVKAFHHLTGEADNDTDAFELLLRLAGWQEEK